MDPKEWQERWVCWEIEQEPPHRRLKRRVVSLLHRADAREAAEACAGEMVTEEMRAQGADDSDASAWDDTIYFVEVETPAGPQRFSVGCAVKLEFSADRLD